MFNRCLRKGTVEAPRLWQKMPTQVLAYVEGDWITKSGMFSWTSKGEGVHQLCSFMWADKIWIMSHSEKDLGQMFRDLIEEASRWDMEPKPASLWWRSTYPSEEKNDMILGTSTGCYEFPFGDTFKVCYESSGENVRCCRRTDADSKQSLLEGHCDIQEQR